MNYDAHPVDSMDVSIDTCGCIAEGCRFKDLGVECQAECAFHGRAIGVRFASMDFRVAPHQTEAKARGPAEIGTIEGAR